MKNTRWVVFDNWFFLTLDSDKKKLGWNIFDVLELKLNEFYDYQKNELYEELAVWDSLLKQLGGDPIRSDWKEFRPLLLAREEGWSDWLAFLIARSKTGCFADNLFKITEFARVDYVSPSKVAREITHEGYRADIVIKWRNSFFTHVEVKVGDTNLSKTYGTAEKMRNKYGYEASEWNDYILLLTSQAIEWDRISNQKSNKIVALIWENVSLALRKSLIESDEDIQWLVWAYSFLGAIEQVLLGHPCVGKNDKKISNGRHVDSMLRILREGRDEKR